MERVEIRGNVITFKLSYPGGGRKHDFRLVITSFKESYPLRVSAQLFHNNHNDPGDAIVTDTRNFDLSPLKELYFEMYNTAKGTGSVLIDIIDIYGSQDSAPLIYKFDEENQILPPGPPLPPEYVRENW